MLGSRDNIPVILANGVHYLGMGALRAFPGLVLSQFTRLRTRLNIKGPMSSFSKYLSMASDEMFLRALREIAEVAS